jgi:hypothetical protein
MPTQDAAILAEILSEADALIRLRLKEQGLELPHLVVGATPDNQIVVRRNGHHEVMGSFGEDLMKVADELIAPPEPGDTTHLAQLCSRSGAGVGGADRATVQT